MITDIYFILGEVRKVKMFLKYGRNTFACIFENLTTRGKL